jgi:L,D-transpeptidase catalytic domain
MRLCLNLAMLAVVSLLLGTAPGRAQPRITGPDAANVNTKAAEAPARPLLAIVSIANQRVLVYDGTGVVAQSPVSTGMPGYPTPTGVFSVLQRSRFHRSNIYSNAPMPFMQRLTWSGVALHAGVLPGYPASHGCIRLPHGFAVELWGMTKIGTRVVVAPDDAPALPIEHARLPVPSLTPVPVDDDRLSEEAGSKALGPALASAAGKRVVDAQGALIPPRESRVDPWQRAIAAKAFAARDAAAKAKAAKLAAEAAAAKAAEAGSASRALQSAELAVATAERRNDAAARDAAAAQGSPAAERAGEALATAEDGLDAARRAVAEASLMEAALSEEASAAAIAAADAEEARRETAAAVKAAERAVAPLSIFVSRKAGRVYIRQAWEPVHEAPVTFTDGPPLGTHLYLAMGAAPDGEALRWLSVSLPASAPRSRRLGGNRGEPAPPVSAPAVPHETAAGALLRFELPEATRRVIADRLWAGASLIVSDHAGSETGIHTDFIVLTR